MRIGIEPIRKFFGWLSARWTERWTLLVVVLAIISGFTMAFVSVIPDISTTGSSTLSGNLTAFSGRNESFRTDGGLSELRLVTTSCGISVTLLNEAQLTAFRNNGTRPNPQLVCAQPIVTFAYPLRWIIIENSGSVNATYEIAARFLDVRYPRGLLAIPALPLAFGGTIYLVIRGFHRGLGRIQRELNSENKKEKM